MREIRKRLDITAEDLSERMRAAGVPFDKTVLANLETGRRRYVTVQELFALAQVLDVAPINLVVPVKEDSQFYAVTPEYATPADQAREWIRGRNPLVGQNVRTYFFEAPDREWTPPTVAEIQSLEGRRDGER